MPSVSDSAKATTARRLGAPQTRPHTSYRDSVLSVVALLLAFRILNALTLRTFFQPDEFFQSLEPAWELAFYVHVAGCLSYAANRSGECTCVRPCIRAYLL
jgi:phosphatidylinositol glycan class B